MTSSQSLCSTISSFMREKIGLCRAAADHSSSSCVFLLNQTTYGGAFDRRSYETDDNVFLQIIRVEYPSIWAMVRHDTQNAEPLIVVVPQGISLSPEIILEDIQTHILHETKVPGEFYSLNGKLIHIDGNDLCTKKGFSEDRRVRILASEEIEDSQEGTTNAIVKVKVLQVSRPLEGGVNAPDDETDELDYASLCKYVAILRSHPEIEGIFKEMDAFITEINFLGDYSTDGFEYLLSHLDLSYHIIINHQRLFPSLEACILAQWQRSVEDALEHSGLFQLDHPAGGGIKERHRLQIAQLVESYLMGGMHRTVYTWVQQQNTEKDQLLSQMLHQMRFVSQTEVGLAPEFHISVDGAVQILSRLADCRTPSEKLLTLKATSVTLFRLVQEHLRANHPGGETLEDFQLTTDDLVQLIIYTIIKTYPQTSSLLLDLRYIKNFHFISSSTSASGYHLNNFEVALDFILSKKESEDDE